jgi:hypothetical protein
LGLLKLRWERRRTAPVVPFRRMRCTLLAVSLSAAQTLKGNPKLLQMVDDSTCDDVICWAEDQRAFHIWRPNILVETIIPKFFGVKCAARQPTRSVETSRKRLDTRLRACPSSG